MSLKQKEFKKTFKRSGLDTPPASALQPQLTGDLWFKERSKRSKGSKGSRKFKSSKGSRVQKVQCVQEFN
jgi:hypothetical protein